MFTVMAVTDPLRAKGITLSLKRFPRISVRETKKRNGSSWITYMGDLQKIVKFRLRTC
jgi:hypothetical protein